MITEQRLVQEFHQALDVPVGNYSHPQLSRTDLRASLLMEETVETIKAMTGKDIIWYYADGEDDEPDFVETIDGLCDVLVVTYGAAVEFGVDLEPFFAEVHRSNMAKQGGPTREDGKKLKPPGWTPPDIAGILGRMIPQEAK